MTREEYANLKRKDVVYYARIMVPLGYYEIFELHMSSIYDDHCSGSDTISKQMFLFNTADALECLYLDREDALEYLAAMKKANKNVRVIKDGDED